MSDLVGMPINTAAISNAGVKKVFFASLFLLVDL
ncbi:hypothetical protein MITS9509_02689 [Synechococcus sp. MIT S9509]|nr:hypothetical protein MITS9504_02042 [Synechococcus sp. MIT S9504]KZR90400.1 hypothetical protein MITS9509_02689 [Synechococcus sp. MIT S9509]